MHPAKAVARVGRTTSEITQIEREIYDLQVSIEAEMGTIENEELRSLETVTTQEIGLERSDVHVEAFVVLWVPVSRPV